MHIAASERRHSFSTWLRTGRLSAALPIDGIERKFNPNHDPRDGRFTFGPGGGARSSGRADTRGSRRATANERASSLPTAFSSFLRGKLSSSSVEPGGPPANLLNDGVFRPDGADLLQQAQYRPVPPEGIGSNSRAFQDPMTLEQAFPGLRDRPGGSMLALADNVFNFTGPDHELTTDLSLQYSKTLIDQIKAVDPSYVFQSLGAPTTFDGQMNQINDLRLDRAAAFYRTRGETAPAPADAALRPEQHRPRLRCRRAAV